MALSINDKENKHAIMRIHESIRRCVHTHQTAPDSYQNALKMALAQVHAVSQSAVQSRLANSSAGCPGRLCQDHIKRGGAHDPCKHVKAVTLWRLRGDAAATEAGEELVSYLQARGVDGNAEEILGTIRARLARVDLLQTYGGWMGWMPSLDFRGTSLFTYPYLSFNFHELLFALIHCDI